MVTTPQAEGGHRDPSSQGNFLQVNYIQFPVPLPLLLVLNCPSLSLCPPTPIHSSLSPTPGLGPPQLRAPKARHGKHKAWMAPQPGRPQQGRYSRWIPFCGRLFPMALGHVTSDHDLVSFHQLTRRRLSHRQRGNLWGKQQGLWEEGEQAGIPKAMEALALCPPTSEQLRAYMKGRRGRQSPQEAGWAAGGLLF